MYFKTFASAALFSGIALVYGQDLSAIPACASSAITQALANAGCPLADTACLCASSDFKNIGNSIASLCDAEEVNAAIAAGQAICAAAPVTTSTSSPPPADPTADPTVTDDASHTVSYTTIPGTVTSTTVVSETTPPSETTGSLSTSTVPGNGTHMGPLTTTGTITVHSSGSGTASGTGAPRQSTFSGDGATEKVHGLFVGAVGLIGAIALL